jgi:nicotinate-nucleotide adenylyltransferase
MKRRIGLFGGTFNPIHLGHLRAAEEVCAVFTLERILFIPSYSPPHKETVDVASAEDRYRMVELACRDRKEFEASRLEVEARQKSYSILTLARIRRLYPAAWVFFILGVDAFLDIGTWRAYERVLEECLFIVMARPGFDLETTRHVLGGRLADRMVQVEDGGPVRDSQFARYGIFLLPIRALDISSTAVRDRARRGERLDGLVPDSVAAFISARQLYRGPKTS